jgi:hypothetical protein
MGHRSCVNGSWGRCLTEYYTTRALPSTKSDIHLLSIVTGSACPSSSYPCDPYCYKADESSDAGATIPAGFTTSTTGLTLSETGVTPCTSLTITPSASTITISVITSTTITASPNPITLTAAASPANCGNAAGNPFPAQWTIDKVDRANISGTTSNPGGTLTLSSAVSGNINVTVYGLGLSTSTSIAVKVNVVDATGVSPDIAAGVTLAGYFSSGGNPLPGTTASTATWLYPYANTYFPMGMLPPVIQYKYSTAVGAGITPGVKVTLRYPAGSTVSTAEFNYALIVQESNVVSRNTTGQPSTKIPVAKEDPQVVIPPPAWSAFEKSARGNDVTLAIQRYRGGAADPLEQETTRNVHFVDGQLKGTVYYKSYDSQIAGGTIGNATGAVLKVSPNASTPTVAISTASGHCTTCHTVSAQGNVMMVNSGGRSSDPGVCNGAALASDPAWGYTTYFDNSCSYNLMTNTQIKTYLKNSVDMSKFDQGAPYPNGKFYLPNLWDNHSGFNPDRVPPYLSTYSLTTSPTLYRVSDGKAVTDTPSALASSLTGTPSVPVTPAFSPDGTAVAYNEGWAIVISEVNPCNKFDGTAAASGSEWEAVEVRNDSPGSLNIDGWTVRNGSGTTCATAPASTTLASGAGKHLENSVSGSCLGDTADTVSLWDAGGIKRFAYAYSYSASACGTTSGTVKGSKLSCPAARNWTTKVMGASSWTSNDTSNDNCANLDEPVATSACGSSSATTYMAGNLIKARDFNCGQAAGSVTCGTGAWSFSNERTVVDCTSAGCFKAGNPSFLPDGSGIVYQHTTYADQKGCSELDSMNGALAQIWLTSKSSSATPIRLNALNGLDSGGSNYLPTIPRDVSTPTGFCGVSYDNTFHQVNGTTKFVYPYANPSGSPSTTVKENELNFYPNVSPQEAGGKYWVIFMTRRLYGNIATSSPWQAEAYSDSCGSPNQYGPFAFIETRKLWIAAIDKNWSGSADPSHPAFYLPGQELVAGNSHGYWVSTPCAASGATCDTNDDCCNGTGTNPTYQCKVVTPATTSTAATKKCTAASSCSTVNQQCTDTAPIIPCCSGLTCPTGGGVCFNKVDTYYAKTSTQREFFADCPSGTKPTWTWFMWQSTVPSGTSIDVSVQSKQNASDTYEPTTPLALLPQITESTNDVVKYPTGWGQSTSAVDEVLTGASTPVFSGNYLQVTLTFNPNTARTLAPSLSNWRQMYDCVTSE